MKARRISFSSRVQIRQISSMKTAARVAEKAREVASLRSASYRLMRSRVSMAVWRREMSRTK